jgi:RNA polymerase sigma factor (sigma-70 family)
MSDKDDRENRMIMWGQILISLQATLIGFAQGLTKGDIYWAEDLVGETTYRILKYTPDPLEIEDYRSYLSRILKNIWIDQWKKRKGVLMHSIDDETNTGLISELPAIEPTALRILENEALKNDPKIKIVTAKLKPDERKVLMLHLEDYNCKEIAGILNLDLYYVKYVLNAVRAKIRYRVEKISKDNKDQ